MTYECYEDRFEYIHSASNELGLINLSMAARIKLDLISSKLASDWLIQIVNVIRQFGSIDFTISISQQASLTLCVVMTRSHWFYCIN